MFWPLGIHSVPCGFKGSLYRVCEEEHWDLMGIAPTPGSAQGPLARRTGRPSSLCAGAVFPRIPAVSFQRRRVVGTVQSCTSLVKFVTELVVVFDAVVRIGFLLLY